MPCACAILNCGVDKCITFPDLTSEWASVNCKVLLAMNWPKVISRRLLLAAIFVGLNALCFLGVAHGHHVMRHTRVNYSHIPAHAGRGSREGRSGLIAAVDSHADEVVATQAVSARLVMHLPAASSTPAPAVIPSPSKMLPRPEQQTELLIARENVLALGSAPRAPGLGRAPPVA